MNHKCPYHNIELAESKFNKDSLVCLKCKEEKIKGRDGIFDKLELLKNMKNHPTNDEVPSDLQFTKIEPFRANQKNIIKDDDYIPNIYDNPDYDDYDGF